MYSGVYFLCFPGSHIATVYPVSVCAHIRVSVNCNTILWLVNLHSNVFVALYWDRNGLRVNVIENERK